MDNRNNVCTIKLFAHSNSLKVLVRAKEHSVRNYRQNLESSTYLQESYCEKKNRNLPILDD